MGLALSSSSHCQGSENGSFFSLVELKADCFWKTQWVYSFSPKFPRRMVEVIGSRKQLCVVWKMRALIICSATQMKLFLESHSRQVTVYFVKCWSWFWMLEEVSSLNSGIYYCFISSKLTLCHWRGVPLSYSYISQLSRLWLKMNQIYILVFWVSESWLVSLERSQRDSGLATSMGGGRVTRGIFSLIFVICRDCLYSLASGL